MDKDKNYGAIRAALNTEASTAVANQLVDLETLVVQLESKHGKQILDDPHARAALAEISLCLGINPLQLSLEKRARTSEFYSRLEVAVITVSQSSAAQNTGCIPLQQFQKQVQTCLAEKVSLSEITKAINDLAVLGPGIRLETLSNGSTVVRTVAGELSSAQGDVYVACDVLGFVSAEILHDNLNWSYERSQDVLDNMVSTGLLWIDTQVTPANYWNPGSVEW